jgi:hypothetical protein
MIEFGVRDGRLAGTLRSLGYESYLGVAESSVIAARIATDDPALAGNVAASDKRRSDALRQNNAEVLLLHGGWGLAQWNWRTVRHAEWIALPVEMRPAGLLSLLMAAVRWLGGFYKAPQILRLGDQNIRLVAFRNRRPATAGSARRFIPYHVGVVGFFRYLQQRQLRHVALRWFETLPDIAPGEDVDLLIDDRALPEVDRLLSSGPGLQALDLYTVTGLPGTGFRDLPYYPPYLAEKLLDGAMWQRDLCRVPTPEHHFLSLAYHALYHKGLGSGVGAEHEAPAAGRAADHDYTAVLKQLQHAAEYDGPVTLKALDAFLGDRGWRPTHDMLARLARRNRWLRTQLSEGSASQRDNGLIVFLIREQGMRRGGPARAAELLERQGFRILYSAALPPSGARQATNSIRGGNWGAGPWPLSGGLPAGIVVAHDSHPIAPTRRQKKKQPFVSNARSLGKDAIRDEFNRGLPAHEHCNVIHSSDNGREALEYLQILPPEITAHIVRQLAASHQESAGGAPVADLTKSGRRAKIEVIRHQGMLAVKKTFHDDKLAHLAREVRLLTELGGKVPCIPQLIEAGDNWFTIPFYDDVLRYRRSSGKLLPLEIAVQAIDALRQVYQGGYALIDASIDNMIVDRREGLKLIDFEFSHRYAELPSSFEESFDIAGCPADFTGDLPIQGCNYYARNWQPYIGLSLESLLHDSRPTQLAKRRAYFLGHAHRFVPRLVRSAVRGAATAAFRGNVATSPWLAAGPAGALSSPESKPTRRAA